MGWDYGWADKASLVKYLTTTETEHFKVITHSLRGNHLWMVIEHAGEKHIVLNLLDGTPGGANGDPYRWGYKNMDEGMHPYYYDCPLAFLGMAPVANEKWRAEVLAHHARIAERRRLTKTVALGDIVTFARTKGTFDVVSLKPLLGIGNDGRTYRLPKARIETVTKKGAVA